MTNINVTVCDYIDGRLEVKKTLLEGLINISALARKIAKELHLEGNIDAIISAIRRYEGKSEKREQYKSFYEIIRNAKLSTRTKLASLLIKRNDRSEEDVASLYSKAGLKNGSALRIFEVTNYIKIIMDEELLTEVKRIFSDHDIKNSERRLGELAIDYNNDITKTPGVFATLSQELAMNYISIIDSMICHWEHIVIVKENDLEKAFSVVFRLTKSA